MRFGTRDSEIAAMLERVDPSLPGLRFLDPGDTLEGQARQARKAQLRGAETAPTRRETGAQESSKQNPVRKGRERQREGPAGPSKHRKLGRHGGHRGSHSRGQTKRPLARQPDPNSSSNPGTRTHRPAPAPGKGPFARGPAAAAAARCGVSSGLPGCQGRGAPP